MGTISPEKKANKALSSRPPRTTAPSRRFNDTASKGSYGLKQPNARTCNDDSVTGGAPSSVHLASECPLQRDDLSDLSGSYVNGSTGTHPRSGIGTTTKQVPPTISSNPSYQKPWRHAKVLSSRRLPQHPQPPADDDMSVGIRKSNIMTSFADVIEVAIDTNADTLSLEENNNPKHTRTPLLLLLMDPGRKTYELMQLWIDVSTDSVKDILQAVSRNLGDWRQDYDGIFGVRNNHFSQLVHTLTAAKYDVQAYEIWVCKPWSMSAKATVGYASTLLNHLKNIGVLTYAKTSDYSAKWKQLLINKKKNDDTILVLSKKALSRVYVPGGVMKHHHACQFLSFTPEFEDRRHIHVDVLSGDDNASALSDSNAPSDKDECSITESTYSTTGTHSPKNLRHNNKNDADTAVSALTKESAAALQRHIGELPIKQQQQEATQPRRLVRLLSALNCAKRAEADVVRQRSPTSILNAHGEMYRVWEEEESVDSRPSVVSASAPLLFSSPTMSEWISEVETR